MLLAIESEKRTPFLKICVEIDYEKVIKRFNLDSIYDKVIHEDAAALVYRFPNLTGDLVISGDMIEHLPKSDGVDLIEYLQYRFKHVILVIPVDWVSLEYENYEHESHVSIWRPEDIAGFYGAYCVVHHTDDGHKFLLADLK